MTKEELQAYVTQKMAKGHIYQPAILTTLLENNGKASVRTIAERCSKVTGKSPEPFEKSLMKYPKEALSKSGVVSVHGRDFILNCRISDLDELTVSRLLELTISAMNRFSPS